MDEAPRSAWPVREMILPLAPTEVAFRYLDLIVGHVLDAWSLSHLAKEVLTRAEAIVRPVLMAGGIPTKVRMVATEQGGVRVQVYDPREVQVPQGAEDEHFRVNGAPGVVRCFVVNPAAPAPQGRHHSP